VSSFPDYSIAKPWLPLEITEEIQSHVRQIMTQALDFRDKCSGSQTVALVNKARQFIDINFHSPDISLNSGGGGCKSLSQSFQCGIQS
jgi:hypothetical protein